MVRDNDNILVKEMILEKPIDILIDSEYGELIIDKDSQGVYFAFEFYKHALN